MKRPAVPERNDLANPSSPANANFASPDLPRERLALRVPSPASA